MSEMRAVLISAIRDFAPKISERKAGEFADYLLLRIAESGHVHVAEEEYESWHRAKLSEPDDE
jgi:hypothetical protein